ncbi:uncharacterized protein C10orf105 homolog [Perognathus longimembris pacificus]|uniref:uncharacterized protein C10orf105 homolog n=1 Tax=Perognathus longimembris pacificus TaxID=214514 RepID=UPI0020184978|nr:uncharacterized protein C10orf105 homolog [Perognathus longimembris pacificus]
MEAGKRLLFFPWERGVGHTPSLLLLRLQERLTRIMNTESPRVTSPSGASSPTFLTAPATPGPLMEMAGPVPVLIALACIFLLLTSCLLFMTLCKPTALDPGHRQARECMPHHPASPSEPRLRLWKRLGSLRRSLHSFGHSRPAAPPRPLSGQEDNQGASDRMESTKM